MGAPCHATLCVDCVFQQATTDVHVDVCCAVACVGLCQAGPCAPPLKRRQCEAKSSPQSSPLPSRCYCGFRGRVSAAAPGFSYLSPSLPPISPSPQLSSRFCTCTLQYSCTSSHASYCLTPARQTPPSGTQACIAALPRLAPTALCHIRCTTLLEQRYSNSVA